jgi:long-chain acyl-CoA synthetase
MLIGELIQRRALQTPELTFWEEGGQRRSYAQLDADSDRVARALLAEGLPAGAHVAICAGGGYPYACVQFGAARAGLVLAHLHARSTAAEVAALGRHGDARLLFFDRPRAAVLEEARPGLPRVRRFVRLPGAGEEAPPPGWAVGLTPWLAAGAQAPPPEGAGRADAAAPFQLLYTSGTTGAPKGALISHRAKIAQGTTHALNLGLLPGDRVLGALPLSHQFAQWLLFASVPIAGATVVALPAFDPRACWEALATRAITHLPAVPTMLYRLLDAAPAEGAAAPSLRCIVYGGAAIDPARIPALRARFPGVRLFQGFGQTETGYCLGLLDGDHERRPESLGRPDPFSEVRLLDECGREVAPGEVGEIVARTPYLMNGYHEDPAGTAAYFAFGERWGRTGDLAVRDGEGYFSLVGRRDDLVVSGGVNLYPAEVEGVLRTHPAVADAAVFGVPDAEWGEALVAAVVCRPGASPPPGLPEALEAHCRAVLAGFKCPRRFWLLDAFPRTPSGKVQKFALREAWLAGAGPPPPARAD